MRVVTVVTLQSPALRGEKDGELRRTMSADPSEIWRDGSEMEARFGEIQPRFAEMNVSPNLAKSRQISGKLGKSRLVVNLTPGGSVLLPSTATTYGSLRTTTGNLKFMIYSRHSIILLRVRVRERTGRPGG